METELRRAIENNTLDIYYQPILDLETDALMGMEALLRWQHPTHGVLLPEAFLPIAEDTGLIIPLGRQIMERALLQMRVWQKNYPALLGAKLTMNISNKQFHHPHLVKEMNSLLKTTDVAPCNVQLDIVETALGKASDLERNILHDLKRLGVSLAIDDFGTGYSSLMLLRESPIDFMKIDEALIANLDDYAQNVAILKAILSFAKGLNLQVIVEGIQNNAQLVLLRNLGCRFGQGYLLGCPVPPNDMEQYLRRKLEGVIPNG
jgi:EAL domain-containing protein (putative c-di-GMP-specific phosphodiesterase class I)